MGLIKLDYVVSFSSQDDIFKVENLLQPCSLKPWLCSRTDKSGRLEAEFQLDKASYIHFIDLGNCGSSTVEIQVSRSSFGEHGEYISFLPAVTLMSSSNVKEEIDRNAVYMFSEYNFNKDVSNEKWDRIKIICCQPYNKKCQFGITFLTFRNKECSSKSVPSDDASHQDQTERDKPNDTKSENVHQPSIIYLREDIKKKPKLNMAENLKPRQVKTVLSTPFLAEAVSFLIACRNDLEGESITDYIKEFQIQRGRKMSYSQTKTFVKLYFKMFHENIIISLRDTNDGPGNSEASFEVITKNKAMKREKINQLLAKTKEIVLGRMHTSDKGLLGQSTCSVSPYMENGNRECSDKLSTQKRIGSSRMNASDKGLLGQSTCSVSSYMESGNKEYSEKPSTQKRIGSSSLKDFIQRDGAVPSTSKNTYEPDDFIQCDGAIPSTSKNMSEEFSQFDGAEPSTSGGISYVECPICKETYPNFEIEVHASTCGDFQQHSFGEEVQIIGERLSRAGEPPTVEPEVLICEDDSSTSDENMSPCSICGVLVKKEDMRLHYDFCICFH